MYDIRKKIDGGLFLVFEGGEGCGKTTQARLLSEWLSEKGYDVLLTKQPGGDDGVCKSIRSLVLDPAYFGRVSPRSELLLFMADKAQHIDFVVKPALAKGMIVISDRFLASTFAYQVVARASCTREEFRSIATYSVQDLQPQCTFWLDVDPAIGLARNSAVPSQQLRFEKENSDFHTNVRGGYGEYLTKHVEPSRVFRVDANQSIEDNFSAIRTRVDDLLSGV